MTFVDTSALYALLDHLDRNHAVARRLWVRLLDSAEPLFTTNYVVVEASAIVQNRLGAEAVRILIEELLPALEVRWIDAGAHASAVTALLTARRRKLSLVDCSSFITMRAAGTRIALAFDKHFTEAGFRLPGQDDSTTRR